MCVNPGREDGLALLSLQTSKEQQHASNTREDIEDEVEFRAFTMVEVGRLLIHKGSIMYPAGL